MAPDFNNFVIQTPPHKLTDFKKQFAENPRETTTMVALNSGLTTTSINEAEESRREFRRKAEAYINYGKTPPVDDHSDDVDLRMAALRILSVPALFLLLCTLISNIPRPQVGLSPNRAWPKDPQSEYVSSCVLDPATVRQISLLAELLTQPGIIEASDVIKLPAGCGVIDVENELERLTLPNTHQLKVIPTKDNKKVIFSSSRK